MNEEIANYVSSCFGTNFPAWDWNLSDSLEDVFYSVDFDNGEGRVVIHEFFSFDEVLSSHEELDKYSVPNDINPSSLIPFACDRGGNYFAFKNDDGNVSLIFYVIEGEPEVIAEWKSLSDFMGNIKAWKYDGDSRVEVILEH